MKKKTKKKGGYKLKKRKEEELLVKQHLWHDMRAVGEQGKDLILVWGILEKHIMLQKQLFNTFNKHTAILNRFGFILHI